MSAHRFRLIGTDFDGRDLRRDVFTVGWECTAWGQELVEKGKGARVYGIERSDDGGTTWFRI